MRKKKIIILGAGIAGLSAAWHLKQKGAHFLSFEKEPQVGGLCRSKHVDGFTFDYDGHLMHFRTDYAFNLVQQLLGSNLAMHKRNSFIYAFAGYTRYPFQANLYGLPEQVVKECLLDRVSVDVQKKNSHRNFLDWIRHNFGNGIARYFMIPYNLKFWTLSPDKLTCSWLQSFIPVPSLKQVLEGTITDSDTRLGYNASFWYPKKGGIEKLPFAFSRQLVNIYCNRQAREIDLKRKEVVFSSGEKENYDVLITTIAMPGLKNLIQIAPPAVNKALSKLKWNSVYNLNLGIKRKNAADKHWVYFPEKEFSFFRVGFAHNFSDFLAPEGKGIIYTETSYSPWRPLDRKSINKKIIGDLVKAGILESKNDVVAWDVNDIKCAYPIYDENYKPARNTIMKFLNKNDIFPCGRYGSWRYMSMEDSILDGKEVSEKVLA
ncbi:MAG: FAD-dependent oxidoreductase [Candidatus Omnitrophica bacterium]|jgi:protoporphyrinogen oxidase|nr:FAD-dependent oxidoreductase [Candidatus Omnitrophota bacterium]